MIRAPGSAGLVNTERKNVDHVTQACGLKDGRHIPTSGHTHTHTSAGHNQLSLAYNYSGIITHFILLPFDYIFYKDFKALGIPLAFIMLVGQNISNRLKAVRFSGDNAKVHKQPHFSYLEALPVELLQDIATCLPLSAAASFALCNKYICYVVGHQYWHHLRSQPLEYERFLGLLEKDMPNH